MSRALRLPAVLLACVAGAVGAAVWSARTGRRVWAPGTFAWRNFLRRPADVERQPGSPLLITRQKFYSFVRGGSVLVFDSENVSGRQIDSFTVSYRAAAPFRGGSFGCRPESVLAAGRSQLSKIADNDKEITSLSVDFVQFADGDTWYAEPPRETVKPAGVRAGARAAAAHLLGVFEAGGAAAVLGALPRIHADVRQPPAARTSVADDGFRHNGTFGHYCGVTKAGVCVRHAYAEGGPAQVELTLTRLLRE